MFSDPKLVEYFGSWVRVQVAFYDFIFQQASKLCPALWKDMFLQETYDGFKDGEDLYDRSVAAIESCFDTFEQAFSVFKKYVSTNFIKQEVEIENDEPGDI